MNVINKGGLTLLKEIFTKSKKKYATIPSESAKQDVPEGIMTKCPNCKKIMYTKELMKNLKVCLHCDYHHPMNSHERMDSFLDEGSFEEINSEMISRNPLQFPRLFRKTREGSKKNESE